MVIDHIGVVVSSLEEGMEQWRELFGYRTASDVVVNSHQQVRVVFLAKPDSVAVKLVQPSAPDSPIAAFARRGGGLHHICFRCADLKLEVPLLKSKGARFVQPPRPGEAFNNRDIAFFLAKNNLNIELIDTTEKTGWRDTLPAERVAADESLATTCEPSDVVISKQ
jgi:methylmalonyl-CoA/ethylmalonyl-CoA epimerase